ncbi:hypothetical protein SH580_03325 [Coraliomargarita algicola]|uniref:Uncharacterized protein n=1 Tax=Coraliomargarita algicola TaxID=3092156 RepID=A0ABZ0RKK4_9BACT|nr:hypothetical protein [Coraliomargarita sp. J2-16]WPJ96735.1 hypothetical protein SH580_03325 [Coraliomargarita sp. J2-16]
MISTGTGIFAADGESAPYVDDHLVNYLFTFDQFQAPFPKIADPLVRGPTWHLLRNYYRLYKQDDPDRFEDYKIGNPLGVESQGSGFKIAARSYFPMTEKNQPQASELPQAYYDLHLDPNVNNTFEANTGTEPILRVTDMAISPLVTRVQYFLSLQAVRIDPVAPETEVKYRLDLLLDPVVTLWNPYNVALSYDKLRVTAEAFKIPMEIFIREPDTPEESINTYLGLLANPGSDRSTISLDLTDTETLAPGEIKVYADSDLSLASGRISGELLPYTKSIIDQTGYRFTKINQQDSDPGTELYLAPDSDIRLEASSNSGLSLYTTLYRNLSSGEERTGITLGSIRSTSNESTEFNWPPADPPEYIKIQDISDTMSPSKHPVGVFDIHLRPEDTNVPVQFLTHYNPRATSFRQYTGIYYDGEDGTSPGNYRCELVTFSNWNNQELAIANDGSGYWGESVASGQTKVVLFELPTTPLHSLAAFQHVNNISNYTQEPAYIVGNSHASPFIPPNAVTRTIEVDSTGRTQVDWSYLCNSALWDSYFFSSIGPRPDLDLSDNEFESIFQYYLDGQPLPNSRMQFIGSDSSATLAELSSSSNNSKIAADAYANIATHLMVDGAFNINSTSIEAWKALLSSRNGLDIRYLSGNSSQIASKQDSPFSRTSLPSGDANDDWSGYRSLSESEVQSLAEEIVDQVLLRGPFTSLADFVNRRLDNDLSSALKGPLQAAIDQTSINNQFSDEVVLSDLDSDMQYPNHAVGPIAAGAPGYLRQSDLLMTLGPVMSARSDTFTIRAYGDYIHPVTGEKTEALCEAVIQRTPYYVSNANDPTDTVLDATNDKFGRRFVIRSFRWLDNDQI